MVATAIAMVHDDLLPSNFIDYSLHSNHIIETPLFISHWIYRAHSRFHWHEQYNQGQRIFDYNSYSNNNKKINDNQNVYICATEDPTKWVQRTILSNHATATVTPTSTSPPTAPSSLQQQQQHLTKSLMEPHEDAWMTELRNVVCPRIRLQMKT